MDKFIFVFSGYNYGWYKDMDSPKAEGIVEFLPSHKVTTGLVATKIKSILISNKLNSIIPIGRLYYNLDNYRYEQRNVYHLIIATPCISKMTISYLRKFKTKHSNVKLYAFLTDSMHASSPHMDYVRNKLSADIWECVLTYDKYDADEFGFTWFGYTYYSTFDELPTDSDLSEIYYVGYNKGNKEDILCDIYNYLINNGVNCRFDVISSTPSRNPGLVYLKKPISYNEVVRKTKGSKCLLEVLQAGQKVQSLRYLEAVVYNKKILSNNINITELPYYDSRYMRYFDKIEDIDLDWIKEDCQINYGYKGDFSPLLLVDFIKRMEHI